MKEAHHEPESIVPHRPPRPDAELLERAKVMQIIVRRNQVCQRQMLKHRNRMPWWEPVLEAAAINDERTSPVRQGLPVLRDLEDAIAWQLSTGAKLKGEEISAKLGKPNHPSNIRAALSSMTKRALLRNHRPGYTLEIREWHRQGSDEIQRPSVS